MPKPSFGLPSDVRVDILCGVMRVAGDPDANTLPDWLVQGAPLGMDRRIETTGVFPPADKPDKEYHSPTPDVSEQLPVGWRHYRSVLENSFERYRAAQIVVDVDKNTLERLFPKGHVVGCRSNQVGGCARDVRGWRCVHDARLGRGVDERLGSSFEMVFLDCSESNQQTTL